MKKRAIVSALIVIVMLTGLAACSHDDSTLVTIHIDDFNNPEVGYTYPFIRRIFSFFVSQAYGAGWASDYQSVALAVEGEGMGTMNQTISGKISTFSILVPAGRQRKITVYLSDTTYGRVWGGHVTSDMVPGAELDLSITMFPMTAITSINSPQTGLINVYWNEIYSNYTYSKVIKGYNVYRSPAPDGVYDKIGQVAPTFVAGTNTYSDNSLKSGATYYYRISTYTDDGEGEMCAYNSAVAR